MSISSISGLGGTFINAGGGIGGINSTVVPPTGLGDGGCASGLPGTSASSLLEASMEDSVSLSAAFAPFRVDERTDFSRGVDGLCTAEARAEGLVGRPNEQSEALFSQAHRTTDPAQAKAVNGGPETPQDRPFTIVPASEYGQGSDVRELALDMVGANSVGVRNIYDESGKLISALGAEMDLAGIPVLKASDSDNFIHVSQNEQGNFVINVDGDMVEIPRDMLFIIDGADGNDSIVVDPSVQSRMFISGGLGDDTIQGGNAGNVIYDNYGANRIMGGNGDDIVVANQYDYSGDGSGNYIDGGAGNDYLEGGFGNDTIIAGEDDDVIYGLDGNDTIYGVAGKNYIDGGDGDDTIIGGPGDNTIFGGKGNDHIEAVGGSNFIAGGKGQNTINAGEGYSKIVTGGQDRIYAPNGRVSVVAPMEVPENIRVSKIASDGFAARVQSDLETFASVESGQRLMDGIAETGRTVRIGETHDRDDNHRGGMQGYVQGSQLGRGSDSKIELSRARNWNMEQHSPGATPSTALYHEMTHSYDSSHGAIDTTVVTYPVYGNDGQYLGAAQAAKCEVDAVGLFGSSHPEISENAFRADIWTGSRIVY